MPFQTAVDAWGELSQNHDGLIVCNEQVLLVGMVDSLHFVVEAERANYMYAMAAVFELPNHAQVEALGANSRGDFPLETVMRHQ